MKKTATECLIDALDHLVDNTPGLTGDVKIRVTEELNAARQTVAGYRETIEKNEAPAPTPLQEHAEARDPDLIGEPETVSSISATS